MAEVDARTGSDNGIELHVGGGGTADGSVVCATVSQLWVLGRHQLGALADAATAPTPPTSAANGQLASSRGRDYGSDNLTVTLGAC